MIKVKNNVGFTLQYSLRWSDGTEVDLRKQNALKFDLYLPDDTTIRLTAIGYDAFKNKVWVRVPAVHTAAEGVYKGQLSVVTKDLQLVTTGLKEIAEVDASATGTYQNISLRMDVTVIDTPMNIGQGYSPKIVDGQWVVFDDEKQAYVPTGQSVTAKESVDAFLEEAGEDLNNQLSTQAATFEANEVARDAKVDAKVGDITELKSKTSEISKEITEDENEYVVFSDNNDNKVVEITNDGIKAKSYKTLDGKAIGGMDGVETESEEESDFVAKWYDGLGMQFAIKRTQNGCGAVNLRHIGKALPNDDYYDNFDLGGTPKVLPYSLSYAGVSYGITATFNQFDGVLTIGRGYDNSQTSGEHTKNAGWFEIDSTKVTERANQFTWSDYGHIVSQHEHGLTLKSPISVKVYVDYNESGILKGKLTIFNGDGNKYEYENPQMAGFACSIGTTYIKKTGSQIHINKFAFNNNRYDKDLWLYGDSYFGAYWRGYLTEKLGVQNFLQAYAGGENSTSAIKSFRNDILHGCPKYILYGMGMNDTNDTSVIDQTWKQNTEDFIRICDEYGIEITFITVPNVRENGSLIENHKKINEYIRNSGRNYIEFANLVEDGDGNWRDGYRTPNDIHPSNLGSAVMAHKIYVEYSPFNNL